MGETPASEKSPAAETVIALLDGRWLTIGPEGVREGQRTFALASLEHAELLPTAPETLAIEVAKLGQIVFQVARRGDGLLALKALYSLRPELRPAGAPAEPTLPTPSAETPMMLPAMPPIAGDDFAPQGMAPAAGSYSYTPYPPYPQQTQTPYSLAPATTPPVPLSGELASFPKSFSDLLAAIFTLYGRSFGALIKLALVAVLIPEAIVGLVQGGLFLLVGINPFGPEVDTTTPILNQLGAKLPITGPTTTLAQAQTFNQLSLIVSLIALIVNAWEATVFTWAAREALYGRRFSLNAMLREGWRGVLPTFGISLLANLILLAAFVPAAIVLVASSVTGSTGIAGLGFALLVGGGIVALWLWVRLALATNIAALRLGHSIRRSWQLTQGAWWRVFGIVLMFWVINLVATYLLSSVQLGSFLFGAAIIQPLAQVILTPLTVLASVALLYDLRLRQDGYQAIAQEGQQQ